VRADQKQLEAALTGTSTDHHRFLLWEQVTQICHLQQAIERVTKDIPRRLPLPPEDTPTSQKDEEATPEPPSDSAPPQETSSSEH